jgi:hypothetical protein
MSWESMMAMIRDVTPEVLVGGVRGSTTGFDFEIEVTVYGLVIVSSRLRRTRARAV